MTVSEKAFKQFFIGANKISAQSTNFSCLLNGSVALGISHSFDFFLSLCHVCRHVLNMCDFCGYGLHGLQAKGDMTYVRWGLQDVACIEEPCVLLGLSWVLFTDGYSWQNFDLQFLGLANRLYTVINMTRKS